MAIEWLAATVEQRKALYRAIRRVMAEEAIGWNAVYAVALDQTNAAGSGYEDNFRAGRISRSAANQIYRWLAQHYPDHAATLDQNSNAAVATDGEHWRAFLQRHGRFNGVAAMLLPEPSIGVVAFARPEPLARPAIPLGAPFCFEISSDLSGGIIAFQNVEDDWHPLPLNTDSLTAPVTVSRQYLPRTKDGEPIALSEETNEGRHGFTLLIAEQTLIEAIAKLLPAHAIPARTLDQIADGLEGRVALISYSFDKVGMAGSALANTLNCPLISA